MDAGSIFDRFGELLIKAAEKMPDLILTFIVGYIAIKVLGSLLAGAIRVSRAKAALKDILMSVVNIALWIFLISAMLQQIGLTQIALALSGFVAVAGIALTAGTSSLVQDLISGVFMAQDPDFNVGDRIKAGEVVGYIERMDARKTRIRDDEDQLHILPNSTFDKGEWILLKKK